MLARFHQSPPTLAQSPSVPRDGQPFGQTEILIAAGTGFAGQAVKTTIDRLVVPRGPPWRWEDGGYFILAASMPTGAVP